MNEWGLPDWRDASAYGDVKRWNFYRWRWEFYRRRDDLRKYFDEHSEKKHQYNLKKVGMEWAPNADLRPEETGFCVNVVRELQEKLGYYSFPNPRISEQWETAIICIYDLNGSIGELNTDTPGMLDVLDKHGVVLTDKQRRYIGFYRHHILVSARKGDVYISFNLDYPLEPQLNAAREWLEAKYEIAGKQAKTRKRRHPKKWLSYLRALDAREAGASWGEMAAVFFGDGILDRRKDPAGGYGPPPPQAAPDLWEAASALRFNF